jgi:hypothetical protein
MCQVLVFNPGDFPDTPSGGLIEKLVPPRTEVFFRLQATSVYAVPSVKSFDRKQRGCIFSSEFSVLFGDSYSYSDCLMNCRIRSIHTLCRCLPFYFPVRGNLHSHVFFMSYSKIGIHEILRENRGNGRQTAQLVRSIMCCVLYPQLLYHEPPSMHFRIWVLLVFNECVLNNLISCYLLCGLVVRVPGYITEMYCDSCEVRTEFMYVM